MNNSTIPRRASFLALILFTSALDGCHRAADSEAGVASDPARAAATAGAVTPGASDAGFLYGRVTLEDGTVYEGRLRFGGDEEALWSNYFNGAKADNAWARYVDADLLPTEGFSIAGFRITEHPVGLSRPFMARFGDIARIDGHDKKLRVTLKSGSVFELERYGADDLADGLRVWDAEHGVADIGEWKIGSIELIAPPASADRRAAVDSSPELDVPLYGTVQTSGGDFTGLIQWNRQATLASDVLPGNAGDDEVSVRFDAIRSIARRSGGSSSITLLDGEEMVLSGTPQVGKGNGGLYVDDVRYGRVLVSWDAFERVDFTTNGSV
jgi:hypothetical protein